MKRILNQSEDAFTVQFDSDHEDNFIDELFRVSSSYHHIAVEHSQLVLAMLYINRSLFIHLSNENRLNLPLKILMGDYYSSLFYHAIVKGKLTSLLPFLAGKLKVIYTTTPLDFSKIDLSHWLDECYQILGDDKEAPHSKKISPQMLENISEESFMTRMRDLNHASTDQMPQEVAKMMEAVLQNEGKNFRSKLIYVLAKDHINQHTVSLASAFDLIHLASLIHDDMVDGANVRRNAPALHLKYSTEKALVIGNLFFVQSLAFLADIDNNVIHRQCADLMCDMTKGELLQQQVRYNVHAAKKHYLDIVKTKTAQLIKTIGTTTALVSGYSINETDALEQMALFFGMGYQLRDDLLDFTASREKIGKDVYHDLKQGYFTYPIIIASENQSFKSALETYMDSCNQVAFSGLTTHASFLKALKDTKSLKLDYADQALTFVRKLESKRLRTDLTRLIAILYN